MTTVADRIYVILKQRKWTQRDFGVRAGLSPAFVSAYLLRAKKSDAASMSHEHLTKLARAAGVTVRWLSTGIGPREADTAEEEEPARYSASHTPQFASLPNWLELRATAEALASAVHEDAPPDAQAEDLAAAGGCIVVVRDDWPTEGALLRRRMIVVRRQRRRRLVLAILHELAHALLVRAGWAHSHGDVWCLTLALAAPLGLVRDSRGLSLADLARRCGVPPWVARERRQMPLVSVAG